MISKATRRQWISAMTPLIVSFIYGCKVGWTSWTTTLFMSSNSPVKASEQDISSMVTISYTGTIISVIVCYTIASKVSRKKIVLACTLIYTVTWSLILTTKSITVIIYCFFAYGVSASLLVIINCIYIGEIASPKNRELIGVSYAVATCVGTEIEYLISSTFNNYTWMAVFPLLVCGLAFISSYFMVESPYYLMAKGLEAEAISSFCWLNGKTDLNDVAENFEGVKRYVSEQKDMEENKLAIIFTPSNLKLLTIIVLINGVSIVHSDTIISQTGSLMIRDFEDLVNTSLFVNAYQTIRLIIFFIGLITIKKFKRRSLFLYGYTITGVILISCAFCYFIESRNDNKIKYLAVAIELHHIAFLLLYSAMQAVAIGILKIEIFPHTLKEFYTSVLAFTSDCFAFAMVKLYFAFYAAVGNEVMMLVYGGIAFLGAVLVYAFIQDTKGKTLHQIRVNYKSCS